MNRKREPVEWFVMVQDPETGQGRRVPGEPTRTSMHQAMDAAWGLAYTNRGLTYYAESVKGRIPGVYHCAVPQ